MFARPVMRTNPFASIVPRSPVCSQPFLSIVLAVASGLSL
jgi:hypothetical protein